MTIAEILPQIQQLPDAEKRRLVELLTAELQSPSQSDSALPSEPLPIWSPHDSYQAASDLLDFARKNGVG
ncbi:hypothetical protein Q31b_58520 [Novipirellula aureliae]|uniref:Uncharacterized protein n=1 Tax=Novipirellula aureliae TaxID=2527966 RepID=A0A5C6D8M5_9BACT|nr:hypothetical protein [Novipirellula aureliae]TWU32057.1 hypothetical protein Q31b_58520 [Novipirellula aureliae]